MTTLREAATAVATLVDPESLRDDNNFRGAAAIEALTAALATPEPDGKDAALLDKLENGCQNEVVVAGLSAAQRIRALLAELDAVLDGAEKGQHIANTYLLERDQWRARAEALTKQLEASCDEERSNRENIVICPIAYRLNRVEERAEAWKAAFTQANGLVRSPAAQAAIRLKHRPELDLLNKLHDAARRLEGEG